MKNLQIRALFHALGIGVYIAVIAFVLQNGERIFGKMDNFFGPLAFLLLFVLSAVITSALVLGKPILMYLDNQKKEALKLFFYTITYLLAITIIIFVLQIVLK